MNILWIEDFGGDLAASENTVSQLFGNLIDKEIIDEEWDSDENLIDNSGYITEFFEEHSLFHKVTLCKSYFEFDEFYQSNCIIKDVDLIIIDINLTNNININKLLLPEGYDNNSKFNEHAGFYIFNKLLQAGYSREFMCLLTGEDQTHKDFCDNCVKLYMQKPIGFEKSEVGYRDIRAWIDEKKDNKRIQLKRAILDGVKECKKNLEGPFEFVDYLSEDLDDFDEVQSSINTIYIENYLNSIESNINNFYFTDTDLTPSLTLLTRAITHEWDNKIDPRHRPFVYILKKIRNTIAHSNLLEQWQEHDAALLFLISMRHILNYKNHPEIFPYEAKLLSIIRDSEDLSRRSIHSSIKADKEEFNTLVKEHEIFFKRYNGNKDEALEKLLKATDLDGSVLKERIYKVLWNYYDDYTKDNQRVSDRVASLLAKPDKDYKLLLIFALIELYD